MATHSITLAWRIPWTEQSGRLQSTGLRRVWHYWVTSFSCIGEGNGTPLQCSCLENPRDGRAWCAAVYGVAQSRTQLKRLSSSSRSNKLGQYSLKNHNLGFYLCLKGGCQKANLPKFFPRRSHKFPETLDILRHLSPKHSHKKQNINCVYIKIIYLLFNF